MHAPPRQMTQTIVEAVLELTVECVGGPLIDDTEKPLATL
jgi:hypothetical protein